ncbi:hypothetical protein V498_07530 [Pseudogymnoascus sp. VKM F-4517 (FW-2822)]|nr:hypothetical protein V498_07530 [Pseudogymnoascus sp. VKM F-4517 (FW-2822)]
MATSLFTYASISVALAVGLYATLLGLLTTSTFQSHVVYLHAIQMTWFKDLNVPETFGFLKNQVTPFSITTSDGERLYAWHILPVELYRKNELPLVAESTGFVSDITSRLAFQLLRDDPGARLVIHMHGAGGTVGSGYRVPNYRALSAGQPGKIHVLTFDYRGFGRSTGTPSENGLILDALAIVDWAMNVAGIPSSRILIFAQSLGTAVSIAVSEHLAVQSPPVVFAGTVMVAPFVDVATLVATYRVAGTVPILSPLARIPLLFNYLQRFIRDKWLSKDRIARYVRANEANGERYRLTIIHAEDDYDIPWHHTSTMFWHAVNASVSVGISYDDLELRKLESKVDLGAAGSVMEWRTDNGIIREQILKTGLHDVIMGYPVITMAVMRTFEAVDPDPTVSDEVIITSLQRNASATPPIKPQVHATSTSPSRTVCTTVPPTKPSAATKTPQHSPKKTTRKHATSTSPSRTVCTTVPPTKPSAATKTPQHSPKKTTRKVKQLQATPSNSKQLQATPSTTSQVSQENYPAGPKKATEDLARRPRHCAVLENRWLGNYTHNTTARTHTTNFPTLVCAGTSAGARTPYLLPTTRLLTFGIDLSNHNTVTSNRGKKNVR